VVTGILFSDISFLRNDLLLWGLAGFVNALHVIGAYLFALYFIIHLYMATLGRTAFSHTKAMITGYEEEPESQVEASAPLEDPLVSSELQKE
jgi:thiosulfate reductase cytochrome b subunit